MKLKDKRVVFCYGDRASEPGQRGVEAMISADGGETWSKPVRLIDWNGLDGGLPVVGGSVPDGRVVTAYYCSVLPDQPAKSMKGYHTGVIVWDAKKSFPGMQRNGQGLPSYEHSRISSAVPGPTNRCERVVRGI